MLNLCVPRVEKIRQHAQCPRDSLLGVLRALWLLGSFSMNQIGKLAKTLAGHHAPAVPLVGQRPDHYVNASLLGEASQDLPALDGLLTGLAFCRKRKRVRGAGRGSYRR